MDIRKRIIELEAEHAGLRAASRATGIDKAYLCRLKSGEDNYPGTTTLEKLGLIRIITYEKFID